MFQQPWPYGTLVISLVALLLVPFIQTLIFAIMSGVTGYDAALGTGNTDTAKLGLIFQMSIIPMIIFLIGTIAFSLMYKISKEDATENKLKLVEMNL